MDQQNNSSNDQKNNQQNQEKNNKSDRGSGTSGGTSNRGFASMPEEKQREIASKGGRAAHESGNAHEFTPEEAREAGRKGGQASHGGRGGTNDDM